MRPRDVGTRAESLVVDLLRTNGFPNAERRALHGGSDWGDITGCIGVCWEVKGGDAAKDASDGQIRRWLDETETERVNAGADIGILVVARRQKGPQDWWACMTMRTYERLLYGGYVDEPLASQECRVRLSSAVMLLRAAGYGDALDGAA